ncbi:hypothetical protein F5888DRAFT_1815626 [Russula emetica]|nr:hypothetical protein F5888DRAFT_1815626 [Russula emetica]
MTSQDASAHLRDASDPHSEPASLSDNVPSWPRPRSPIPPHRLAKLVNALGISAPLPPRSPTDPPPPPSPLSTSLSPEARRSPVPSLASTSNSPVPLFHSKFLLHVVPPSHIPHESSASETFQLTPPPSSASGYHTQFRRGTLVPLLPTLQGQLWAIAKEYALPSTAGMILYLVSSTPSPNPDTSSATTSTTPDEPGPRLSEDIWKHLWMRVAKFESESYPRAITPNTTVGLGFGYGGPPSPLYPQPSNTLRPLLSSNHVAPQSFPLPLTPTGSTASSNPPTQASFSETSQSEVDSPDSSLPSDSRAATLDLPGLTSPSIIPILAKVEFDIDKRRAAWYGPWIRSRKLNHQKRENRARTATESGTSPIAEGASQGQGESDALKAAPLPLKLVDRQAIPRFLLSVGDEGDDGRDSGSPRLSESPSNLEDPDPVGVELSGPAETEGDSAHDNDEQEVQASSESQERPRLSLSIPPSPPSATVLPTAGIGTANTYKKAAPPPLTLMPYTFSVSGSPEPSPLPSSSSTGLAYLRDGVSTPSEGDKRTGTVFDELDLGLEFEDTEEFDEDDPNDRRRSQYVLKAKLDEIEKTLVRLSPRTLQHETQPQNPPVKSSSPSSLSLSSINGSTTGSANSLLSHSDASRQSPSERESNVPPNAVWPTVPHYSLKLQAKAGSSLGPDSLLATPKFSLNDTPSSIPYKMSLSELGDSKARRREPDDYEPTYPEVVTSSSRGEPISSSSPIIPLSPDPFGRYPSFPSTPSSSSQPSPFLDKPLAQPMTRYSAVEVPPEQRASGSHSLRDSLASTIEAASRPPSSRFSLDSTDEGKNNRISASLNPVKSIKSLWKKSRKVSISSSSGSIVAALQIGSSPPSPQPPPRVPSISSTPSPAPSTASRESVTSLVIPSDRHAPKALYHTPSLSTSQLQQSRSSPSMRSMFFNQESPYPVHVLPSNSTRRRRTASQTARAMSSASLTDAVVMRSPPLPPPPPSSSSEKEKEKATAVPRSILKSRRTESSTSLLLTEQHAISRSQSRTDAVLSRSTSSSGGGRVTPPSSSPESTRVSPTKSRQRVKPPPLPFSQPSPDG